MRPRFPYIHEKLAKSNIGVYETLMRKRQRIDGWLANYGIYMLSAAITVGSCISVANAQRDTATNDETAMAVPHLVLPGSDRIEFPHPLSPSDAALIRHILNLQENGEFADAKRELTYLNADWMAGPILAARYLSSGYKPTAFELREWLRYYGDQSDSGAIAARLKRIGPVSIGNRTDSRARSAHAAATHATGYQGPNAARSLFSRNRDAEAVAVGHAIVSAVNRPRPSDDLLAAGLAAWRQFDRTEAVLFFSAAYETAQTPASRAAAAFWIAHTNETGDNAQWLRRAAIAQDTFYGRLARRKLGLIHVIDINDSPRRTLGAIDFQRLLAIPRARRAFGLLQIGDKKRAEDELRALSLDIATDQSLGALLPVVADTAGMSPFAQELRIGYKSDSIKPDRGPPVRLKPNGGFVVDPTLVYGIVQHESNFHNDAVSSLGARGLMQIMPSTARGIGALPAGQNERLAEPGVNLSIGQRILLTLANDRDIHGDLLRLLSAYGQGQGAMKRWVSSINDGGDPLMFVEAVPSPVLRSFLFDALAASWRYAVALRLPAPSLDDLAEGRFPTLNVPSSGVASAALAAPANRSGYLVHAKF